MPKVNKHAEVKPSKFKTSYCQYFTKGEECPFGARCAFAHGAEELKREEENVYLIKTTGLMRLEAFFEAAPADEDNNNTTTVVVAAEKEINKPEKEEKEKKENKTEDVATTTTSSTVESSPSIPTSSTSTVSIAAPRTPVIIHHHHPYNNNINMNNMSWEKESSPLVPSVCRPPPRSVRRPIMISLPKHGTASESVLRSPYAAVDTVLDLHPSLPRERRPLVYRHNPYRYQ